MDAFTNRFVGCSHSLQIAIYYTPLHFIHTVVKYLPTCHYNCECRAKVKPKVVCTFASWIITTASIMIIIIKRKSFFWVFGIHKKGKKVENE